MSTTANYEHTQIDKVMLAIGAEIALEVLCERLEMESGAIRRCTGQLEKEGLIKQYNMNSRELIYFEPTSRGRSAISRLRRNGERKVKKERRSC